MSMSSLGDRMGEGTLHCCTDALVIYALPCDQYSPFGPSFLRPPLPDCSFILSSLNPRIFFHSCVSENPHHAPRLILFFSAAGDRTGYIRAQSPVPFAFLPCCSHRPSLAVH